jgi:hypothetical protein
MYAECHKLALYTECRYAECHNAESYGAFLSTGAVLTIMTILYNFKEVGPGGRVLTAKS